MWHLGQVSGLHSASVKWESSNLPLRAVGRIQQDDISVTEYIAVAALFFSNTNFPPTPFASPHQGWHFRLGPEHCQLPLGIRKVSFPETDKVQTTLVLKLQFLIRCKAPFSPGLRSKSGTVTCSWGMGVCFHTLGVPPPIALTLLGLQQEGQKGKGQNSPVNELVPPSPAWQMSKPWFCLPWALQCLLSDPARWGL